MEFGTAKNFMEKAGETKKEYQDFLEEAKNMGMGPEFEKEIVDEGIKSLKELRRYRKQEKTKNIDEAFDLILKDKFDELPQSITFKPELTERINGIKIMAAQELRKKNMANVVIFFNDNGQERHTTLTIDNNGVLHAHAKLPVGLTGLDLDRIKREVIIAVDSYGMEKRYNKNVDILPEDPSGPATNPKEERGKGSEEKFTDMGRIEFLIKQPDFLFAAPVKDIRHYDAYFFDKFTVLESAKVGDAAFILPCKLDEKLIEAGVDRGTVRDKIIEQFEENWGGMNKKELGHFQTIHGRYDEWIKQMIDKLNKLSDIGNRRYTAFSPDGARMPGPKYQERGSKDMPAA